MKKKTIILLVVALGLIGIGYFFFVYKQPPLSSPNLGQKTQAINIDPSKTLKTYTDPSGFSFNYPDNLSISSNELKEVSSYAELQITSKDVGGNLAIKIADSKFKTINDWVKTASPSVTPKEVTLGNLKALEIESNGKVILGALDSGIFFNIEVNFAGKKDFWMNVYGNVLKDFSFASPEGAAGTPQDFGSSDDVSFDGEEIVE